MKNLFTLSKLNDLCYSQVIPFSEQQLPSLKLGSKRRQLKKII